MKNLNKKNIINSLTKRTGNESQAIIFYLVNHEGLLNYIACI